MTTTTISLFRAKIKQYVDFVMNGHDVVIINRGSSGAVLMSLDEYNSMKATEKILSDQKLVKELSASMKEETIEVDINSL